MLHPKLQVAIGERTALVSELGEKLGVGRVKRCQPTQVGDQIVYYFADRRSKAILPALYIAMDGTVQSACLRQGPA